MDSKQGHTVIQSFADAIHAAMGDKESRALQDIELRNRRLHNEMCRNVAKRSKRRFVAKREHNLVPALGKGRQNVAVKLWLRIEKRPQRDIDERPLWVEPFIGKGRGIGAWKHRRANKFVRIIKGVAIGLKSTRRVDDIELSLIIRQIENTDFPHMIGCAHLGGQRAYLLD